MIAYLIKSAFCLALLLAAYHLMLEKEKIHQFKRFFLLASLLFSLTIPLLSINIFIPRAPITGLTGLAPVKLLTSNETENLIITPGTTVVITQPEGLVLEDYLLISYSCITTILLLRFGINLLSILLKARRNEQIINNNAVVILINEPIIPNSFLQYIFVNREDYMHNKLEPELLLHELVHVRQKHSFDIILIELLKAILWFNPLLFLYKKAIQLNHEFLADQGVIHFHTDIKGYQKLLLNKAGLHSNYALASNFNYSVTKKRLIMMRTSTTKLRAMLKELALLPLLIVLIAVLCVRAEAQQPQKPQNAPVKAAPFKQPQKRGQVVVYADRYPLDSVFVHYYSKKEGVKSVKSLSELSLKERSKFLMFARKYAMAAKKTPNDEQFKQWKDAETYGVWLDGKRIKNDGLDAYRASDFVLYYNSKLYGAAKKGRVYSYQVDLYTPTYYEKIKEETINNNNTKTRKDVFAMLK